MTADLLPDVDTEFAMIVDELTRRGFLAGGLSAAALLGLSACGSDDRSSRAAASGSPSPTTRTVTTTAGTFTVPADPSHIVSIDYFTAIFLVELGLTPAGGIDYSWVDASSMYPAYIPTLKKVPDIGQITSTDYEKVTALHPDLILGPTPGSRYDNSKGAIKTLSAVAPVASVDFGQTGDWRSPLAQTAELVNRAAQLKPIVDAYQATVAKTKTTYADLLASTVVSVIDYSQDGNFALDLPKATDGVVLADLGVRFGKASADNGTSTRELSVERLSDLADSDIILYRADAKGAPTNGLDKLVEAPGLEGPARREGRPRLPDRLGRPVHLPLGTGRDRRLHRDPRQVRRQSLTGRAGRRHHPAGWATRFGRGCARAPGDQGVGQPV